MSNLILSQETHVVHGIAPVADAFAGTVATDVVDMANAHAVTFWVYKGVGTTGTSTITVEACDDTVPTNTSAVAFAYRANTTSDTFGALTWATSAGFTTTAGSNHIYAVHVDASMLANSGYRYVRLKAVESANDPVLGGVLIQLHNLRYPRAVTSSQLD